MLKKLTLNGSMKTYKNSRTNTQKRCPFHYRGLECKSRKSRNTWSHRQIWSWNMEWSRAKTNRVLPIECTGHSKHPLPTTQEKTLHMDITRWSTPKSDWLLVIESESEVTQSCLTLWDPVDCSPPGSSVHGILQARILEWVAISFSRGIFPIQGSNPGLLHCRQMLYRIDY